ncbi:MAG: OsmC family protein [Gammaproteobacteria bacterium]|nr:OsmC family protein [Gammaproteobacteria bacterium]
MRSQKISFTNQHDIGLAAYLDLPDHGTPRHMALLTHCFTCSKQLKAYRYISQVLTEHGYGVMRLDFTGIGDSQGRFDDTTLLTNVEDVIAASDWLTTHHQTPALLIGHSLGGIAVLSAAASLPGCRAVAVIGTPDEPHDLHRLLSSDHTLTDDPARRAITLGGKRFELGPQLLDSLRDHNMTARLAQLQRPLLILQAPDDDTVSLASALRLFTAAQQPKSFIALDGCDHLLNREQDARHAAALIVTWARRYLEPDTGTVQLMADHHPGKISVRLGHGHYLTSINAAGHVLNADEPRSSGGGDLGPSPYQLLCASLGACTAITLRMYADRKGWPLDAIQVILHHDKVRTEGTGKVIAADVIQRVIELRGALDATQRQRLLEVADHCPVHRSLHGTITVNTILTD